MRPIRIAIVGDGRASRLIAPYLPNNYWVLGRTLDNSETIIAGRDESHHTLTLEHIIHKLRADDIGVREQHMIAPTPAEMLADALEVFVDQARDLNQPMAATMLASAIKELKS